MYENVRNFTKFLKIIIRTVYYVLRFKLGIYGYKYIVE